MKKQLKRTRYIFKNVYYLASSDPWVSREAWIAPDGHTLKDAVARAVDWSGATQYLKTKPTKIGDTCMAFMGENGNALFVTWNPHEQ